MDQQKSDLADDIVQGEAPQHIVPPSENFRPWHKVRKQFIRIRQWNTLIERMVKRYLKSQLQHEAIDWSLSDDPSSEVEDAFETPESVIVDRPLRCLVIPGDDLMDIRSLWSDLRPYECFIRYLGFNESYGSNQIGTRVHIANNEVTSLHQMAQDSIVIADRFQSIASQSSAAYRYVKQYGPFHIVNLDLCDSLFPTTAQDCTDYFNAIHRLAEYQMKNQTTPWLLFITTQVEPHAANVAGLQNLCGPTRENRDKYPNFARLLEEIVPTELFSLPDTLIDISVLAEEQMVPMFGVALGKWLIKLAASAAPEWIVQMLPSHRYSISDEPRVEMLSLAFQFRARTAPPIDSTGMSQLAVTPPLFPDELECAVRLLKAVQNISDVDALLRGDSRLYEEIKNSSADLIESSGYDREKYIAWVHSGEGANEEEAG